MAKIYTKTGDTGNTSLYNGERVSKNHELIHATGTVDECNSLVGFCVSLLRREQYQHNLLEFQQLIDQLELIQSHLFCVGAHVATPRGRSDETKQKRTQITNVATHQLEEWIDEWQVRLKPLHQFILPGGHWLAASLHHARCECRHAERHLAPLLSQGLIEQSAFEFVNRLSDYLFVVARLTNHLLGVEETPWHAPKHE